MFRTQLCGAELLFKAVFDVKNSHAAPTFQTSFRQTPVAATEKQMVAERISFSFSDEDFNTENLLTSESSALRIHSFFFLIPEKFVKVHHHPHKVLCCRKTECGPSSGSKLLIVDSGLIFCRVNNEIVLFDFIWPCAPDGDRSSDCRDDIVRLTGRLRPSPAAGIQQRHVHVRALV